MVSQLLSLCRLQLSSKTAPTEAFDRYRPKGCPWCSRPHQLPYSLMLDLGFVRDHLPLVEEKLRQRGMDPAVVLEGLPRHRFRSPRRHHQGRNHEGPAQPVDRRIPATEERRAGHRRQPAGAERPEGEDRRSREDRRGRGRQVARHLNWHSQYSPRQRARRQRHPTTTSKSAAGELRRNSTSLPSRTGNSAKNSASSTSNAPPRSPARALPCIGTSARSSSAR